MKCDKCGSDRILKVCGKTSDMFNCHYKNIEHDGYVPDNIHVGDDGYGDYVQFDLCMECGKIQGKFPVSDEQIENAINKA